MLDWYIPHPQILCPSCGRPLSDWQGKGGPCALLVFRQGVAVPIDQRATDDARLDATRLVRMRVAEQFNIDADCCDYAFVAECTASDGVWINTKLVSAQGLTHKTTRGDSKSTTWPASLQRRKDELE